MSELPKPSFTNPNIAPASPREEGGGSVTEQQIPHSGNLPEQLREQPVQDFDNTSLPEAVERELLQTPTSPASLPEAQPAPEQTKKGKKGLVIGVSAGLAGAALVAGSIIGLNAAAGGAEEPEAPVADPKGTTEVTPEPTASAEPEDKRTPEQIEADRIFNLPKPERWDELDAMTLEEFNQQSIEARVEYATWLNRDASRLAELWHEASNNPLDEVAIGLEVHADNSAEEIEASTRQLMRGAVSGHFQSTSTDIEIPYYDVLQRKKMLSGAYLEPGNSAAVAWQKSVEQERVVGWGPDNYVSDGVFLADETNLERGETYVYTDSAGVERSAADTTWRNPDGSENTATNVLIETPSGIKQWVTVLSFKLQ